jgi:hypothetical protein
MKWLYFDGQTCHVNVGTIHALIIEHRFAKNYGPRRIISELCHLNIPDCKIPAQKQLENRL